MKNLGADTQEHGRVALVCVNDAEQSRARRKTMEEFRRLTEEIRSRMPAQTTDSADLIRADRDSR
jgi:hypothetical protein